MDYPLIFSNVADLGSNINPSKPTGVSCTAFDTEQEILWVGNYSGHLTSFVNQTSQTGYSGLVKYTSFHIDYDSDIRQVSTCRDGVLSLTKNFLRLSKRRGLTQFTHKSELFKDLQCMLFKSLGENKSGHVYLAGNQETLIDLDLETLKHTHVVNIYEPDTERGIKSCHYVKGHPKFLCMADGEGKIVLRDSDQLQVQHEFKPTSPISSMDVCGNYLVTCSAYSQLLMIYDLREMKLVSATQLYLPTSVKFLSRFTTKCCYVSRTGQFAIVDLTCPNNINQSNQINLHTYGAEISAFDVSATDQAFAFGDNHNFVYVHGTCDKFTINTNPKHTEYADAILQGPYFSLTNDYYTPVSEMAQFPYYAFPKLSDFRNLMSHMPAKQCIRTYRPTPPIAPDILRSMRVVGNIGYVVNPSAGMMGPSLANGANSRRNSPEGNEYGTEMPHRYHFLEPNHNKVDKDEYDFSRYNHSPFPGLDSTMPNSYANNLLQCLYFILPMRASIVGHICSKEYCLICEMGFLFNMLDNAPNSTPCQASNFLRAFRTIPEVSAFKLILPEDEAQRKQVNFCKLTQQWLRFLLHQLNRESLAPSSSLSSASVSTATTSAQSSLSTAKQSSNLSASDSVTEGAAKNSFVADIFAVFLTRRFKCSKCRSIWQQPHVSFPVTLNYPFSHSLNNSPSNGETASNNSGSNSSAETASVGSNGGGNGDSSYVSFVDLLTNSILTEQSVQGLCNNCGKFHHSITEKRFVSTLPNIFAINTGLDNEMTNKFWQNQISQFANMAKSKGKTVLTNLQEMEKTKQQQPSTPVRGGCVQQPQPSSTSMSKPIVTTACRYGRNCKRSDCKFYHAHLSTSPPVEGVSSSQPSEEDVSSTSSSSTANNKYASWIPQTLYIVNGSNGAFEIKDKKSDCQTGPIGPIIEYSLINVTSVVKTGENAFGNIVSAVKIDRAYFDERRRAMMKKRRRYMRGTAEQMQPQLFFGDFPVTSDTSETVEEDFTDSEEETVSSSGQHPQQNQSQQQQMDEQNEHHLSFTVDSRSSAPIDFEKGLSQLDDSLGDASGVGGAGGGDRWYLFNHYSINPVTIEEVLSVDLSWKLPTTLMYIRKDYLGGEEGDEEEAAQKKKALRRVKNAISPAVFDHDISVAQVQGQGNGSSSSGGSLPGPPSSFVPLEPSKERIPKRGDIVAMDAEFVMLNHEETELRSDGTRATIKPSHKSVARISCVRGSGPMEGMPFIDDYICTQDQVADYMTKFSGIQPGDLDATLSSKHLTTLKSTYLKLRFLVDNGVIFVGHGLRNDFRVINLVVPPEQVIDTVFLFQSPNSKRMVSLRFLARHFLGLSIQGETHDSVEDAKTALALYHKYKDLEAANCALEAIEELYAIGKGCGWKVG